MYEYLIGAGAMKSGTTLLYNHMLRHPQILRGGRKELHYFDTSEHPDKAEYDGLFPGGEGLKMDISPFYMYHAPSVERMARVLDPQKTAVLVILREPVDRAFSHYRMRKSQGMEDQPFEATFDLESSRTARSFHDLQLYSYFTRGLYAAQLDRLYAVFPKENIRVYLFENFVKDQQSHLDAICDFAGIERITIEPMQANKTVMAVKSRSLSRMVRGLSKLLPKRLKAGWMRKLARWASRANERKGEPEKIAPAFEQKLVEYYRADVARLKEKYGLDISPWKRFA